MRRRISDLVLSACALFVLFAVLMAFDSRVREQVSLRMGTAQASTEIATVGAQAQSMASVLVQVAKDQTRRRTPMVIFLIAASALTVFMLRT